MFKDAFAGKPAPARGMGYDFVRWPVRPWQCCPGPI